MKIKAEEAEERKLKREKRMAEMHKQTLQMKKKRLCEQLITLSDNITAAKKELRGTKGQEARDIQKKVSQFEKMSSQVQKEWDDLHH